VELTPENVHAACKRYAACQHPVEVYYLLRFLRKQSVQTVVELGVHRGGLAAVLSTFLPGLRLAGVEVTPVGAPHLPIEDPPLPAGARTLVENAAEFGFQVIEGSSYDPASRDRALALLGLPAAGRVLDFVFVDAAHDYHSVQRDYALWSPHARWVGFHDLYSADVLRFWGEITPGRTIGIWKEIDGLGIGVC
jgi:hypothetical protein